MKNIYIFVIVFIILIIAHELYVLYVARKVGSGVVLRSEAYTQKVEDPTKKVLFLGDSLAFGVGAIDPKDSLAGRLGQDYPTINIDNFSKSGRKIADQLSLLQTGNFENYDQAVLQIGGNDVLYFSSVEKVKKDIESLLLKVKKIAPDVTFLWYGDVGLAPGLPKSLSWFHHKRSLTLREIFINTAQENDVKYVDLYEGPGKDTFGDDAEKYYSPDMIHPSGEGYALWYERLKPVLEK